MRVEGLAEASLASNGARACELLCAGDFTTLAEQFGYAFARGVAPEAAIREDLGRALAEVGAKSLCAAPHSSECLVELYAPNDTKLIGAITCPVSTDNGSIVVVDLIVARDDLGDYIKLEEIHAGE
jgi:hypothetical protein